ncbi:hypothetical protein DXG01_013832 [Tephrocybe rancida]|nr:hypothetical protein DXG01_013832 [Tephrocybe rancida]
MRRKGKEKAQPCTPPLEPQPEPTTEDEDKQLAADMGRAALNSTTTVQQPFPESVVFDEDGAILVSSNNETDVEQDNCNANVFVDAAEENLRGQHRGRHSKAKAYVVFEGRIPGVYKTWYACHDQVSGHPHNRYQGFCTLQEAQDAWNHSLATSTVGPPGSSTARLTAMTEHRLPTHTPSRQVPHAPPSTPIPSPSRAPRRTQPGYSSAPAPSRATFRNRPDYSAWQTQGDHGWLWSPEDAHKASHPTPQVENGVPFLSNNVLWYAVIEGRNPGVHQGRSAAQQVIGRGSGVVRIAATQAEANEIFMKHKVKHFE